LSCIRCFYIQFQRHDTTTGHKNATGVELNVFNCTVF